ncbi:hypothetical protein [Leptospira alstonii]|uniref:hypothetical protein n=1 Tax=Leptospira alstonii TaxID=28452 RepID=UPI00056378AC|nr:hypothetical protein [Leptospira alstonii]
MNPAIEIDKEELKKRFEVSGILPEQIELVMDVFEQSSVPLKISFPFEEFIKDVFTLKIVTHDLKKNDIENGKFYVDTYNFSFTSENGENFIPINYLKMPEFDLNNLREDYIEIKLGVLDNPITIRDIIPN